MRTKKEVMEHYANSRQRIKPMDIVDNQPAIPKALINIDDSLELLVEVMIDIRDILFDKQQTEELEVK